MQYGNIRKMMSIVMAISLGSRLLIAGILLTAVTAIQDMTLRVSVWVIAMSMVVYVIYRLYKFVGFMRITKEK
jgi:type III secretory pathway component EscS